MPNPCPNTLVFRRLGFKTLRSVPSVSKLQVYLLPRGGNMGKTPMRGPRATVVMPWANCALLQGIYSLLPYLKARLPYLQSRAQLFLRICTHTHTTPISSDLCPPMLFKFAPMYSKIVTLPIKLPIISHPCPPKSHEHGWAWAPNVGLCYRVSGPSLFWKTKKKCNLTRALVTFSWFPMEFPTRWGLGFRRALELGEGLFRYASEPESSEALTKRYCGCCFDHGRHGDRRASC